VHLFPYHTENSVQNPASRAMDDDDDDAKPLLYNGDQYSLIVSKAGKNKSGSQQHGMLLKRKSPASRLLVATSVDHELLRRVVAKATSTVAQTSFRGRAQDAFASSSSLLITLKRMINDTRQELARERLESATDPLHIQARLAPTQATTTTLTLIMSHRVAVHASGREAPTVQGQPSWRLKGPGLRHRMEGQEPVPPSEARVPSGASLDPGGRRPCPRRHGRSTQIR
jgi:hypothetical protein